MVKLNKLGKITIEKNGDEFLILLSNGEVKIALSAKQAEKKKKKKNRQQLLRQEHQGDRNFSNHNRMEQGKMKKKLKKVEVHLIIEVTLPENEIGELGGNELKSGIGPWCFGFLENSVSDMQGLYEGSQRTEFSGLFLDKTVVKEEKKA